MTSYALDDEQRRRAGAAAESSIAFLESQEYPLGVALVRHVWMGAPAEDVVTALAVYQNEDGGFGNGLEVDIASPVSNAFAARLAMQAMRTIDLDASKDMRDRLGSWLVANQDDDGDWRFAPEVYDAPLPPWFAGWEFPSLNPACCVVGNAIPLGIATPGMRERVARLFDRKASPDEARSGDFYPMLPYVEYIEASDVDGKAPWYDAIADGVRTAAGTGAYGDAQHFFDHAINAGPDVVARLPADLLRTWTDKLLDEQLPDGGWPTPYDPRWRPWTTTSSMLTLARLRDGV